MNRWFYGLGIILLLEINMGANPNWANILEQADEWYATPEAAAVAESVVAYQSASGGWPKNIDMTQPPLEAYGKLSVSERAPTIDNDGTTRPLQFLAKVNVARPNGKWENAMRRGIDYLLEAQYGNGGWPQFYPLRKGYYSRITYNDNAMVNVLGLLQSIVDGSDPWKWVDEETRKRVTESVGKGIDCILATQARVDGRLTAWCAQHDETTLEPTSGRSYEIVSLSGSETVGIVRFLMSIERPSPEIEAAINGAVRWLIDATLPGLAVEMIKDAEGKTIDRRLVPNPDSDAWARFYEIGTNRPIYSGRSSEIHYTLSEVEQERRSGYGYIGTWARDLLAKEFPAWRGRIAAESEGPVLYLVGDSTMADKTRFSFPERGWGQALRAMSLRPLRVDNHAMNGRSSKSFINEGRWADVMTRIKPGDWVLIQFGHNDEKVASPDRYAAPWGTYHDNLTRMVREVKARGGNPLLATSVARRKWNDAKVRLVPTHGEYPAAARSVAEKERAPLLEMEILTTELEESVGFDGSKALHLWFGAGELAVAGEAIEDDTHYSALGAFEVAQLAVAEFRRLGLPLARYFPDSADSKDLSRERLIWNDPKRALIGGRFY